MRQGSPCSERHRWQSCGVRTRSAALSMRESRSPGRAEHWRGPPGSIKGAEGPSQPHSPT
jgi:hypothetical protein